MNPIMLFKSGAIVVAVLAVFFTGMKVEEAIWVKKQNEEKEQIIRQLGYEQTKSDEMNRRFTEAQAALNKLKLNSTERTLNEVNKNSADYACLIPDGGLRLIHSAIREANSPQ